MRKLRTALIGLGATASVVGGGLVGAPAAQAADTWQAHDKVCKALTGADAQSLGSACAEVQKRVTDAGSVNGYRGRVTVSPAAGQWVKPTTYNWSSGGLSQVCSGGCAQQTSAWTSAWSPVTTTAGTYTVRGEISGGYTFDVAASWSSWAQVAEKCATYTAGKFCVYRHERGYRDTMQERAKLTVAPAAGKWIEPRWVRVGTVMNGTNTYKTRVLCDPSCTRRTAGWSATVARTMPGLASPLELYASAKVALPSGDVKTIRASLFD
ncbi:hypothetical protein [Streptomyces sp. NL15-2K]|uniref:hypothetical protein n=1 Tax=Streptomyces sp. NL15-2K TaxID=376149 RepID=UPI000F581C6D|nr:MULTISPECIES: hypothetical protein [Actinomycetes]WKX09524.1 hypothetical protein Q4V64_19325 [Kutzneria buriramensis]GCB48964.1 hypothetical protein SNL152K_6294 [Streptomyces sp. NL15-2K]